MGGTGDGGEDRGGAEPGTDMTPVETIGKTANNAIEALKTSPALLVITIFLTLYIGLESYLSLQERERWKELVVEAMRWCPAGSYQKPQ